MTQPSSHAPANRRNRKLAFALWAALASSPGLATTWERLPIERVYEAADVVAYVELESAAVVRNGSFGCGARYVAKPVIQLKGRPLETVTFFGYSGVDAPAVGGEYLVFLAESDLSGLGMMSTNSYSMQAAAELRRRCDSLLAGFKPIPVYGLMEADWNLVTRGTAFKVLEHFLKFPDSVGRAGEDGDFGETDRLYGARWYPIDQVLGHLRGLQRLAEPSIVVRRGFLHYRDFANMVQEDPSALADFVGSDPAETGPEHEELLEIAGRAAVADPKTYLQAIRDSDACFGIATPGWRAMEDNTWKRERQQRRDAIASVNDPELAEVRQRCLEQLDQAKAPVRAAADD